MSELKSVFEALNSIDVSEHIEKKGKPGRELSYLSWAWAWAEVKKAYPETSYKVYESETGCIYHTDGKTAWVKTGVTINGLEHIEYLPVMDYANNSIPLERITSFDVNKSIQRSLTKACARHGLGLYIYAGEDLPESAEPPKVEPPQQTREELLEKVNALLDVKGIPEEEVLKMGKVNSFDELDATRLATLIDFLSKQ